MLRRLELRGYRGFENHTLDLRDRTVIVGHNNAGKSTVVEALRLLGIVTERLAGLNFRDPPAWTDLPIVQRGVAPSLDGLGIQFPTIGHRYSTDPAVVNAVFSSGESIHLSVNADGNCFATLRNADGQVVRTKNRADAANFPRIEVLPQISPLEREEQILNDDYVRRNLSSPLASRHFRNQLRIDRGAYRRFRTFAEETWPGIKILNLDGANGRPKDDIRLMVRDRDFAAEVGLMGHGLQMWLQTMWFLSRSRPESTIVLDEPDVYMHPDLQRKLIRVVRHLFPQIIIATHSIEIIADLDPSEILVVDRKKSSSKFADTLPAVQTIIENIGGVHNVHLARLWSSRRCLLVEGDDLSYLKSVHDKIFPDSESPLDGIPNSSIGGWDGWNYGVGHSMFARNAFGKKVRVYCLLDSDYRTPDEICARQKDAKERGVDLHIWKRKEIENYFLIPKVIARVVANTAAISDEEELAEEIRKKLFEIAFSLQNDVLDAYATSFLNADRARGLSNAMKKARQLQEESFATPEQLLDRASGKEMLKLLSRWLHKEYGRGLTVRHIAREIRKPEVPVELRKVIQAIEESRPFPA